MTSDTRTSEEIERDITDERAQLTDTISDLQKKFSVEGIMNDVGTMVRDQGGDFGRSVSDTVGRNPAAVVLVGVGLAWLFLGKDRKHADSPTYSHSSGQVFVNNRARPSPTRWDDRALPADRMDESAWPDDCAWYDGPAANDPRLRGSDGRGRAHHASANGGSGNGMMKSVRDAARSAGDRLSGAASDMGEATSDMTDRLSHGLDDLSEEAKSRVVAARRAAHETRLSSGDAMRRGSRHASDFYRDQPLVVGALAVAMGAAIGGMLPSSRVEDDAMGDSSDRFFDEAQDVLREEREKAKAVLRTAASDAKDEMQDAKQDMKAAGDTVADRASEAAERVAEGAKDEAENQGLGRGRT